MEVIQREQDHKQSAPKDRFIEMMNSGWSTDI